MIKSIIGVTFDCPNANELADFYVDNLKEAEELALRNGAIKSDVQYFDTSTVMFDPSGHPFCLSTVMQ
ncbi:MAG: hypothetical protein FWG94_13075 [Oscillospiraceae bacterium]|nr:hypothetical protein [Oscillospiraceae bacterium]